MNSSEITLEKVTLKVLEEIKKIKNLDLITSFYVETRSLNCGFYSTAVIASMTEHWIHSQTQNESTA